MMKTYNEKQKIIEHYDVVSPYYHSLWGEHLHHGYWVTGRETKEEAQLALTKHLAEVAGIKPNSAVLDVGCGFGASSIYLAKTFNAQTVGITISSVQVEMANAAAAKAGANCRFLLMDAEAMDFEQKFDVVWSIESISHYTDKKKFFERAVRYLKPGGTFALIDWFKKDSLSPSEVKKFITPIEEGMLVELLTMDDYASFLSGNGLSIMKTEDLNKETAKTWEISLGLIKDKALWKLALRHGGEFVNFLRSFQAMKNGFASSNFVYGLIVARKPQERV